MMLIRIRHLPIAVLLRSAMRATLVMMCVAVCAGAVSQVYTQVYAQQKTPEKPAPALSSVTVTAKANRDPVEKPYRKMIRALDIF